MPEILPRNEIQISTKPQDLGKLHEIDNHQLLQGETGEQVATFDQVLALGEVLLKQKYGPRFLKSSEPTPAFFHDFHLSGDSFICKIALPNLGHFPATAEVVSTERGIDLKLHIASVELSAFETRQFSSRSEALIAVAAAAVAGPQFLSSLREGLEEMECENPSVSVVQPEHATPLAVIVDGFNMSKQPTRTLEEVKRVTKKNQPTIQDAAHIHGKRKYESQKILSAAGKSTVAGGITFHTFMRHELSKHALFFPIRVDAAGNTVISTLKDSLSEMGLSGVDASFIAVALGMTSSVVGNPKREKMIEEVFTPENEEQPLESVLLQAS